MSNYSNFEWYYFDFHSEDGYDIICTIHPKPFNSIFNISIFDIFIYRDNKIILHHYFVRNSNELQIHKNGPFVIWYNNINYVKRTDNRIEVLLTDQNVQVYINFIDLFNLADPIRNELVKDKSSDISLFNWIVYAPFCEAKVNLKWDDNSIGLSGWGYHDYNSGAINLKNTVKQWYWSKFYIGNQLIVYGEITAINGKTKKIGLLANKQRYQFIQDPKIKEQDNKIYLNTPFKEVVINIRSKEKIDDVYFYISKLSGLTYFVKIMEFMFFASKKYSFKFLSRLIANSHYTRTKIIGYAEDKTKVTCFYERMYL